jgi:hypothetical protein
MSRYLVTAVAASVVLLGCSDRAPDPTEPLRVAIFSDAAARSDNANGGNFGTPLSADEEVPPNASRAVGNAIFQLSADGTELSYKLIVANIHNVFQAHIHNAAAGVNGPIVVWLYPSTAVGAGPPGGGRIQGVIAEGTITAANFVNTLAGQPMSALVALLENGGAYVNVHTSDGLPGASNGPGDIGGGEIRGQVEHRGH